MTTSPGEQAFRVAIVGAGVAGAAAASVLRGAGIGVEVFEKARGPGGRMSRRRTDRAAFDHGAPCFTARTPGFASVVAEAVEAGAVAPWEGRIVLADGSGAVLAEKSARRFVGVPGMNALVRFLLDSTPVTYGARVARVDPGETGPSLAMEDGSRQGPFDFVVVTAPAAQAGAMAPASSPLAARASGVPMRPTWAGMLAFDTPIQAPFDGAFVERSILSWAARDSSKPGRPDQPETWVVHAGHEWSEANLERDASDVIHDLAGAFATLTGASPSTIHARAHRWRFAAPANDAGAGPLIDPGMRLALAGDWCAGGRVEAAFSSGDSVARRLIELPGSALGPPSLHLGRAGEPGR